MGDMALFACHDDQQLCSPVVLDMITNGIVYEALARSDGYLKSDFFFFFTVLGSMLDGFFC